MPPPRTAIERGAVCVKTLLVGESYALPREPKWLPYHEHTGSTARVLPYICMRAETIEANARVNIGLSFNDSERETLTPWFFPYSQRAISMS